MNVVGGRADVGEFRRRYKWLALAVVALALLLIGRLFTLQILQHDQYAATAKNNIVHSFSLATSRGIVRDRNGVVLATSRESWNVYVIVGKLNMEQTWPKLAELLGLGPFERAALEQRLRTRQADEQKAAKEKGRDYRFREMLVRQDISRDVLGALETNKELLPAVSWVSVPMRSYPTKELNFHLLGYVNEVTKEDKDAEAAAGTEGRLRDGDRVGRTGLERSWESYLRGERGWRKFVVDASGRRRLNKEDLVHIDEPREKPPTPGRDVRLTIDAELTATAQRAFAGQLAGAAVMVEVRTGRVLVAYSKPGIDPNDFVVGLKKGQAEAILNNPLRPLIDKTMFEAYFPGSTMKPFSALAALNAGVMTETTPEVCEHFYWLGKTRFKCEGAHGQITLHDALVHSCNIYFYHVGERVGIDAMSALEAEFGLGQRTGIGVSHEVAGLVPTKAWYNQHYGGQFRLGFTLNAAIGQGNTKVTVLQLALAYAALANGGTLWAPQVVRSIEGAAEGGVRQETEFPPRVRRQIPLPAGNLRAVLSAMHGVVNEEGGTAYKERSTKVDVAGKTGTAQVSKITQKSGIDPRSIWYFNRDHAWFGGFAPYNDPEVAVVALVEHGGGGGHNAAPIAMRLFDEYFAQKARLAEGASKGAKGAGGGGK